MRQLIFQKFAELGRNLYQRSVMPVLGSKLLTDVNVKYTYVRGLRTIMILVFALLAYLPMLRSVAENRTTDIPSILVLPVTVAMLVYEYGLIIIYFFDVDALEVWLKGYKKTSYYIATKETLKSIARDAGLIGEYKSYVLSRSLSIPHRTLFNVCVPMRNGSFAEVDAIIITRNIIYVIECKNRGGDFVGEYDKEDWVQYIGGEEHPAKNIYMQNQKHIMAIEQFLLDKGIIQNGQNVCLNMVLTTGDMTLPTKDIPLGFSFGDAKYARKIIEQHDSRFDDGTDTTGIMEEIYETLLPYALYTKQERQNMMQIRTMRSESKEFATGGFRIQYVEDGIPGVTEPGETAVIRSNRLYTQVQIEVEGNLYWQTRTDIGSQMAVSQNQISRGVDKERIDAYKQAAEAESRLSLKKTLWPAVIIAGVILLLVG